MSVFKNHYYKKKKCWERSWYKEPFSSVQLLSCVRLFVTLWIAARQASLSITNSWSSPKLMCIKLVMPPSCLILCHPLLLPPIRIRWPKYWSCKFKVSTWFEFWLERTSSKALLVSAPWPAWHPQRPQVLLVGVLSCTTPFHLRPETSSSFTTIAFGLTSQLADNVPVLVTA